MRVLRWDYLVPIGRPGSKPRTDQLSATLTAEGFLRVEGRIMRAGSLEYGDADGTWYEYRSRDEIEKALPSFDKAVVTLGHPAEFVSPDNVSDLYRGHMGSRLRWDDELPEWIRADILVTHREALKAIEDGVAELSVGFTTVAIEDPGTDPFGQEYRFRQTDLIGNHLSIEPEGRAGPEGRLLVDSKRLSDAAIPTLAAAVRKRRVDGPTKEGDTMEEEEIELDGEMFTVPTKVANALRAAKGSDGDDKGEGDQEGEAPPPDEPEDNKRDGKADAAIAAMQARLDVQSTELTSLRRDRTQRELSELRGQAARLGVSLDGVAAKADAIRHAVVVAKLPTLASKLDANKANPGYLQACFDQIVEAVDAVAAEQVSDAILFNVVDGTGGFVDPLFPEGKAG